MYNIILELKALQKTMMKKALNKDNTIVMEMTRLHELIEEMEDRLWWVC